MSVNIHYAFFLLILHSHIGYIVADNFCELKGENCEITKYRYLLYDVNPPEGFNLRRDVYMRFAIFAHNLKKSPIANLSNFKLVLPPWTNLYHWKRQSLTHIPWSHFFDLNSLQKFAPVIEMHEFFNGIDNKYAKVKIDNVFVLQHFEEMFNSGKFEDKMEMQKCNKKQQTNFYYYNNITSNNIKCLSFHGHVNDLTIILKNTNAQTILFDHAEVALHDNFGNKIYWQARRSMRFNKYLQELALSFRNTYLNSSNNLDMSELPSDWRDETHKRTARGGPYLSVHLRRKDFAIGRPDDVPSIKNAAEQIRQKLQVLDLNSVFISTDAPYKEFQELEKLLNEFRVVRYIPTDDLSDGALAIIDQIICSHARYFMGTHDSTFSFRIQEEREIMGFPEETTFNRLCGKTCEKPSVWKIVN